MANSNDKPKTGPGSEKCEVSMEALSKARQDLATAPNRAAQGRKEMDEVRRANNHTDQTNHDAVVANNKRSLAAKEKAYSGEYDIRELPKRIPGLTKQVDKSCAVDPSVDKTPHTKKTKPVIRQQGPTYTT